VSAIVAGLLMVFFGWFAADPLASGRRPAAGLERANSKISLDTNGSPRVHYDHSKPNMTFCNDTRSNA